MKTILLAGGFGTRILEETRNKPKPMVEIGGKPILWHLMSIFAEQGFNEFIIATGYKSEVIEKWVANLNTSWKIEILFTGLDSQTGGRIKQAMDSNSEERFFVTYGDGLANVDLQELLHFHKSHKGMATVTAVHPPARFGFLDMDGTRVARFGEKLQSDVGWINGGFFVFERFVSSLIESTHTVLEAVTLPKLVKNNSLFAYKHEDFWQPMDTLRDRNTLDELCLQNPPPWLR